MLGFFLGLGLFLLILVSCFLVLIVLMQRSGSGSGMGAAIGGGAAEAAFGAGTGNILSRTTIQGIVVFFILAFLLYLGYMVKYEPAEQPSAALPDVAALTHGVGLTESAQPQEEPVQPAK